MVAVAVSVSVALAVAIAVVFAVSVALALAVAVVVVGAVSVAVAVMVAVAVGAVVVVEVVVGVGMSEPKPIEERIAEWLEVECDLANDEYQLMELFDIMECAQDDLRRLRAQLAEAIDLASAREDMRIMEAREPTQDEGDRAEGGPPDYRLNECFVDLGGWTGRRCYECGRWVWGGPTLCLACYRESSARESVGDLQHRCRDG